MISSTVEWEHIVCRRMACTDYRPLRTHSGRQHYDIHSVLNRFLPNANHFDAQLLIDESAKCTPKRSLNQDNSLQKIDFYFQERFGKEISLLKKLFVIESKTNGLDWIKCFLSEKGLVCINLSVIYYFYSHFFAFATRLFSFQNEFFGKGAVMKVVLK